MKDITFVKDSRRHKFLNTNSMTTSKFKESESSLNLDVFYYFVRE